MKPVIKTVNPEKDRLTYDMPVELSKAVTSTIQDWQAQNKVQRLWSGDPSLWTNNDENQWLGWLSITDEQIAHIDPLLQLAQEIQAAGFTDALLMGMGGSSLCPEVLATLFGNKSGYPKFHVLDSTDPAQIKSIDSKLNPARTIYIVSSKSGTTLEPNIFMQYFWEQAKNVVGADKVGQHFIAITDPGSHLHNLAQNNGFRHAFLGLPTIGGRYSALSNFGMVPAAIMGVDVKRFLNATQDMVHACSYTAPVRENPGAALGIILGILAMSGRDKVTLAASPQIYDLGAWLEQLLAESTGKDGRGLIPVDLEHLGIVNVYGNDRLFIYLRLEASPDLAQDKAIEALRKAGQPVIQIAIPDINQIGQEFFRWEFATAVAGSIIGINAFNQPDVEASKIATRELTAEFEMNGQLPPEMPFFESDGIKLYTDEVNSHALNQSVGSDKSLAKYLHAHLNRLSANDYFAILSYIEMNTDHQDVLQDIRHAVRDKKHVATCLEFGPRFLHSTGQAYKGGPNTGVFLQVTADDAVDMPVPNQKYSFGIVKSAQARGDFKVLTQRKRRTLRVHFNKDIHACLQLLKESINEALT